MRQKERTKRGERGAALVEMAIVLPLLVILVFGIVEFGMAFNERLTIGNSTQSAARVGSAIANNKYADISILEALEQGLISLPDNGRNTVKTVWVYKADAAGEPINGCPGAACNIYTYKYDPSGCNWFPTCPDPDTGFKVTSLVWNPEDRNATVGSLDVLGVRVHFAHAWITGALPLADISCTSPTNCWSDTAIMRLEPQQLGVTP